MAQLIKVKSKDELISQYGLDKDGNIATVPPIPPELFPLLGKGAEVVTTSSTNRTVAVQMTFGGLPWEAITEQPFIKPR